MNNIDKAIEDIKKASWGDGNTYYISSEDEENIENCLQAYKVQTEYINKLKEEAEKELEEINAKMDNDNCEDIEMGISLGKAELLDILNKILEGGK